MRLKRKRRFKSPKQKQNPQRNLRIRIAPVETEITGSDSRKEIDEVRTTRIRNLVISRMTQMQNQKGLQVRNQTRVMTSATREIESEVNNEEGARIKLRLPRIRMLNRISREQVARRMVTSEKISALRLKNEQKENQPKQPL